MARYRRKRQTENPLITLVFIALLGLAVSISQSRSDYIMIFVSVGICLLLIAGLLVLIDRNKKQMLSRSGIEHIDQMSGLEFEKYLQALLLHRGYRNVKLTLTYDLGVDLIAVKDDVKWAIQAKRYKSTVGLDAIRQVVSAAKHYGCDRSMVITNSYFTRNAQTIAHSMDCVLVDRPALIRLILEEKKK